MFKLLVDPNATDEDAAMFGTVLIAPLTAAAAADDDEDEDPLKEGRPRLR